MTYVALALSFAGLGGLCLAMPKHHRQLFGKPPSPRRSELLRLTGWLALAGSFAPSIAARGWQIGPVLWVGLLSVSALTLVLVLPYLERARA